MVDGFVPQTHLPGQDAEVDFADRRGAELLFQVFTEREERSSIAIASNSAFSEWARTFTDPRLCAAIVDRLTFDDSIIETGTESFRLRTTKRRSTPRAS
ncbi:MAG TPA: ATP-binding protein [Amycolatopsis sp.]|nr:ATP-binding protein [Amycolatopsis sp.]